MCSIGSSRVGEVGPQVAAALLADVAGIHLGGQQST